MNTIPVYFLILPDTLLLDVAGFAEAFRVANQMHGGEVFSARFIGPAVETPSSVGIGLSRVEPLPDSIESDAWIVVPGLRRPEVAVRGEEVGSVITWLRQTVTAGHTVCCVCAGALVAAEAGLLDGRACTSHHDHTAWLSRQHPRARVFENRLFVRDGNLFTSAGVTSGVDLALALIAERVGPVVAARVARDLVVYIRRTGSDPQVSSWLAHRNHLNPVVHRVQDAIIGDPTFNWTLCRLAESAHVSVRTLSRLFRDETGTTPIDYLREIRLALAREHLETSTLSIERVAEEAGFRSALQLRRLTHKRAGASPRQLRHLKTEREEASAVS